MKSKEEQVKAIKNILSKKTPPKDLYYSRLESIISWYYLMDSDSVKNFNISMFEDMLSLVRRGIKLSSKQMKTIDNVIEGFKIDEAV